MINIHYPAWSLLLCCAVFACSAEQALSKELDPPAKGLYSVGSTNMEVASRYSNIGDEAMHEYLLGLPTQSGESRYIKDILKNPESAWLVDVQVPDQPALYGPAKGQSLPVVSFLTYPASLNQQKKYSFPYHDSKYGVFDDMLDVGETPNFADPGSLYPLIILAHGSSAHGIYDVRHAQNLASHGYIVAVIFYGDDRTVDADSSNDHLEFLRPLITKAVLDSIIDSDLFGSHIDIENIGISGHSFGGFTALAMAGGAIQGNTASVIDKRITAGVIAAPWVGGINNGKDVFAFGTHNDKLNRVTIPMICFFGTRDKATLASFVLPATKQLLGPSYVVELVDQPHIFEQGSWEDRDNWELLFFSAYLKNDPESLAELKVGRSMKGGNEDIQLFDYQRPNGKPAVRGKIKGAGDQ